MKVLVTGAKGQLGCDVCAEIKKRGHEVIGIDIEELDITDENATFDFLTSASPDAVIHCAAWTAVDAAEDFENFEKVFKVNGRGTLNVAKACKAIDCKLLYLSTDYVFGNDGFELIDPENKDFEPQGIYAKSKLVGELAVMLNTKKYFIVRTSWVFGLYGKNFVSTMIRLAETHKELNVVSDQVGRPTYTPDLARLLADMIESDKYGFYHATNEGEYISWADFAREILNLAGFKTTVNDITTMEYNAPAQRPLNSRLDTAKLVRNGFEPLPEWKDALKRYLSAIKS